MSGLVMCVSPRRMMFASLSAARWEMISSFALETPSSYSLSRTIPMQPMVVGTTCPEKGTCSGRGWPNDVVTNY